MVQSTVLEKSKQLAAGALLPRMRSELMGQSNTRKPGRRKGLAPTRETVVALKGSTEWKSWLDGFSSHCRLGLADTIEQSLVYYATVRDYEGPPKR